MTLLLWLVGSAAAAAYAWWTYARRELTVGGWRVLAGLRAATLALVLLLLLDPRLPGAPSRVPRWVLVDASASMAVGPAGATPWDSAAARARALRAEGARVLRFGAALPPPPGDSALGPAATDPRSLLLPALERAAEAGAREVVVLSDLRLEDPVGVRAGLDRLGLGARFEAFGAAARNAGVAELDLPADLSGGRPVLGQAVVFASGGSPGDSLRLEVHEEERLVWSGVVAAPTEGRTLAVPLRLPPPAGGGEVRYRARAALAGDAFPPDDEAVAYATVDRRAGAVVLVSLAPDWEPRHLLPALARATGLPARGWLQAGGRFLPLVAGPEPGAAVDSTELAARLRDAEVVVLHGFGADAPGWLHRAAERAPRLIVFAADPTGARAGGEDVGPARVGEWYVDPDLPSSPLAAELAGLPLRSLPPLTRLLEGGRTDDGAAPFGARFRGGGVSQAPLVLRDRGGRRVAVVLASGWWRWAVRPGPAANAYARMWSGVAGWLLGGAAAPPRPLQPTTRVVPAGAPVEWRAADRETRLAVLAAPGAAPVLDTLLAPSSEAVLTPALPAGTYRYRALAEGDTASGRFDVRPAASELRHPRMDAPAEIPPPPGRESAAGGPLRASPVPYLLVIGMLCAEWIGRRRRGLR